MPKKFIIYLFLIVLSLLSPGLAHAEEYFFQEEFNQVRPDNTLDPDKWIVYPNTQGNFASIKETNGLLITKQVNNMPQYPYIVSKKQVIPGGDWTAEIKFYYSRVTGWGTGIVFSDIQPQNQTGILHDLININVWQDRSGGPALRLGIDGVEAFSAPLTLTEHIFKVEKIGKRYYLYFDNELKYTSPEIDKEVKYLWMGNPDLINPPIPSWTEFNVDYIRITQTAPEPFLDLPWDYENKGLSFNDASMRMTSYFDHSYPLLSSSLSEHSSYLNQVTTYENENSLSKLYSSHDGYDYAKVAKALINNPVLAAADGEATFLNTCGACGNAILIDHKNGFQTRYYHLQKEGLVTNIPGQKVNVAKGQQIGLVGWSGNVFPANPEGAHIHFMVVNDKDKDGDFENNLPDGVIDPFGWQSSSPDPWENYTFYYNGKQRTGSKSYYLFTKQLDNLNATLTSNGGVFNSGRYELKFPEDFTDQNLNLTLKQQPNTSITDKIKSLGAVLFAQLKDDLGTEIMQYQSLYTLTIDALSEDLERFKPNTVSVYSSQDGQTWQKEQTTQNGNKFQTQINHMTYFVLAGELIDTLPPETKAILEGTQGESNNYKSDVTLSLTAADNEGGLGIYYTLYKINNQDWTQYNSPLNFNEEGLYKVEFYSADNEDNLEEVKSVEFKIDKTPPEANISVNLSNFDLEIRGIDDNLNTIEKLENLETKKKNDAIYKVTDLAGNFLEIDVRDWDKEKADKLKIFSLSYNNTLFEQPNTQLNIKYKGKNNILNLKEQNFQIKGDIKLRIKYDHKNNESTIITKEFKEEKVKETLPGLIILQLQTNQGILEYSY